MFQTLIQCEGSLSAKVQRADGTIEDYGVISGSQVPLAPFLCSKPMPWWEKLWRNLKRQGHIPTKMSLGAFLAYEIGKHLGHDPLGLLVPAFGIVTGAGAAYLATDFASAQASPHIGAFVNHDCGTGGAYGSTVSISAITNTAAFTVTTSAPHGKNVNDIVFISGVAGATGANNAAGGGWLISAVGSATTFTVANSGGSAPGVYTSGGTVQTVNGQQDTAMTTTAVAVSTAARVAGTHTNPTATQYQSQATLSFTSSAAISEWGLFSALTAGTLWDRRWFNTAGAPANSTTVQLVGSTIGVGNGDSITFTYLLNVSAGGS